MSGTWLNKIVAHAEVPPGDLKPHPLNFRTHPALQQAALAGAITEVGFVRSITVNRVTGHILDGHERVSQALRTGQAAIPVEYVEVSEEEERKVLACLDPIAELAEVDKERLTELLGSFEATSPGMRSLVGELTSRHDLAAWERESAAHAANDAAIPESFQILITCRSEDEQRELLDELVRDGHECRAFLG